MTTPKTYAISGGKGEKLLVQLLHCQASKKTQLATLILQISPAHAPTSVNLLTASISLKDYAPLVPFVGELTIELTRVFDDGSKARPATLTLKHVPIDWI